jgi:hypothetical protein
MNRILRALVGFSVLAGCACIAPAQDAPKRPAVLQITREFVKPGRAGSAHDKTESVFVDAMRRAKWPTYYIGLGSLSGKSRALFLTRYDSFEAYEKDQAAIAKNTTLSNGIDKAYMADGDLLEGIDQAILFYREDMSLHTMMDISGVRYMELLLFHIKPGKDAQWTEEMKIVKDAYDKGVPGSHWATYELLYGGDGTDGGSYLVIVGHKSLDEIDKGFAQDKDFRKALGDDGMKKLDELSASCTSGASAQLFYVNPKMSYVEDSWIKADPDFWLPKPAAPKPEKKKE